MAAPFVITSPTNSVLLGPDRTGQAAFTVSNQTGKAIRVRATPTALDPTQAAWLSVVGPAERDYPIGGTEQITIAVLVPTDAAAGTYPFRLDVASVINPDDDWANGPVVAFDVPELPVEPPPPTPPEPPGYLETVLGALGGGLPLGAIGAGLGLLVLLSAIEDTGDIFADIAAAIAVAIVAFLLAFALGMIGMWIGASVGAGLVLRIRGFRDPWRTAVPVAVLVPVWAVVVFTIILGVVSAIASDSPAVTILGILLAALISIAMPALAGRAYARWRMTGGL